MAYKIYSIWLKKLFFETNLRNFFNFISIDKILRTIYLVCGKSIITNISEKKIILQIIYHCLSNDSEVDYLIKSGQDGLVCQRWQVIQNQQSGILCQAIIKTQHLRSKEYDLSKSLSISSKEWFPNTQLHLKALWKMGAEIFRLCEASIKKALN